MQFRVYFPFFFCYHHNLEIVPQDMATIAIDHRKWAKLAEDRDKWSRRVVSRLMKHDQLRFAH